MGTSEQLARLRTLAEQATPGPWESYCADDEEYEPQPPRGLRYWLKGPQFVEMEEGQYFLRRDADFIVACDPQTILGLVGECSKLRERFADATRFCPGDWPCEASTSAASLEKERNELQTEVERLRDKKMREAMEGVLAHADRIEEAAANMRERAAQVAEAWCDQDQGMPGKNRPCGRCHPCAAAAVIRTALPLTTFEGKADEGPSEN